MREKKEIYIADLKKINKELPPPKGQQHGHKEDGMLNSNCNYNTGKKALKDFEKYNTIRCDFENFLYPIKAASL